MLFSGCVYFAGGPTGVYEASLRRIAACDVCGAGPRDSGNVPPEGSRLDRVTGDDAFGWGARYGTGTLAHIALPHLRVVL